MKRGKSDLLLSILIALFLVLSFLGATIANAAGESDSAGPKVVQGAGEAQAFDMHAPYVRYHFTDPDMDFTFGALVLGATINHGCEIGEAFYTVANIKDGDAASWQEEWIKMAARVEARGEQSLAAGHRVSAREQLQRAAYYYRAGLIAMLPDDPRLKPTAQKSRALMKKAGALFDPPMEYVEIPFEGTVLPGYFRKAKAGAAPTKTLLMIGGGETFAEDLVFYIMPQAIERGYNFLTVDLPGQGLLPLEKKYFRPDQYISVKAVVDYALSRPDVDPARFAAYGFSGGGGFAPQTAQHDPRIRAVAMNSCVVDGYAMFAAMEPVTTATPEKMKTWTSFHVNNVKSIANRWGVSMDNIPGLVDANKGFTFDPAQVTIPALVIVGEGEYQGKEVQRQQKLCLDGLPNPMKKMIITPLNEGASNHCVMENRSIIGQVLFDWLDEVFK